MWPTLFKFGNFEVTTFGLMMFLGFVVAGFILTRQFKRYGLSEDDASTVVLVGMVGGIVGAKIYYAILYRDAALLFDRAGLVWYGGLIGGAITISIYLLRKKIDYFLAADALAPALTAGYILGRIGCFLVGDDYGRPTESAVGVAFPKGAPPSTAGNLRGFGAEVDPTLPSDTVLRVHPTQLYEVALSIVVLFILLRLAKRPHTKGIVMAAFLVLAGIERFIVEIFRAKDDRFLGMFTVAQLISVILIVIGVALWSTRRRTAEVVTG